MFEQEKEISQIIEKGLEEILAGSATVEEVARRHPDQSEELRLELDAALWLISRGEKLSPRPGFIRASRGRVVARVRQEQAASGWLSRLSSVFGHILMRRAARSAVALLMILAMLMLGTGVVSASQSAVPGESLYPVKRIYEQVSFSITVDAVQRASLSVEFSEHRLSEAEELVTRGNFEMAKTTLQDYQKEVQQAVTLLQQVNERRGYEREALALYINKSLVESSERLASLVEAMPQSVKEEAKKAHEVTEKGAFVAVQVDDEERQKTATPEPSSTSIATAVQIASPSPSVAAVPPAPGAPALPVIVPADPLPQVTETPLRTFTDTPKPTNVSQPTNENQPTQRSTEPANEPKPADTPTVWTSPTAAPTSDSTQIPIEITISTSETAERVPENTTKTPQDTPVTIVTLSAGQDNVKELRNDHD